MNSFRFWLAVFSAGVWCVGPAQAQVGGDAVTELKGQMALLTNQVRQLRDKLESLEAAQKVAAPEAKPAGGERAWTPSAPIPLTRAGANYMNLSLDAVAVAGTSSAKDPSERLELGDHDPQQRGGQLRGTELSLDGNVDPYFKGQANIALKLDKDDETGIELEEVYLQTLSLPGNLQLKAGQFFAEFGRQNATHPHTWSFVDSSLVLNRMFGGDGLRNPGARVSWLAPTPFYTELMLGVFNGQGGTAFSFRDADAEGTHGRTPVDRGIDSAADLLYVPRIASSFDLTANQTLVVGASAALGPNDSGPDTRTRIYGVDQYWKWKPAGANAGFPFVSWQTEVLWRDYEAGADPANSLPAETLHDWGLYSQLLYGFTPGWVAGFRWDYVTGNEGAFDDEDPFRGERTRIAPNITYFPSEFTKVRLQYNADHGEAFGDEQSVWLQVEFLLGAHGAHKF